MQTHSNQPIEIIEAELVGGPVKQPPLLERLLSPENLQRMMASGGGLLVIGFAIWLWSIGVFENAIVLALSVGAANLAALSLGVWMFIWTRLKLAGRGLTLLASMVLPLNLWLLDSQGLVVLAQGGPLWLVALVCCVIYAIVARLMKDSLFVYTLVGGVALTGVLFLAGAPGNLFWSIIPLVVFLASLGGVCITADSWFLDNDGPFARDKFGKAFFYAGHIVLSAGLALLAFGQFADFVFDIWSNAFKTPEWMKLTSGKVWVLCILIGSTVANAYSNFTRRRHFIFTAMASILGGLAIVQTAIILQIHITVDTGLTALAIVGITINLIRRLVYKKANPEDAYSMAMVFSGIGLLGYAFFHYVLNFDTFFAGWNNVVHLILSSVVLLTIPGFWQKESHELAKIPTFIAGLIWTWAALATVAGLAIVGIPSAIVFVCAVALAFAIISLFLDLDEKFDVATMAVSTTSLVFWVIAMGVHGIAFTAGFSVAITMLALAVFAVISTKSGDRMAMVMGAGNGKLVITQFVVLFDLLNGFAISLFIMAVGVVSIFIAKVLAGSQRFGGKASFVHHFGNAMVCIAVVGASLFAFGALSSSTATFYHVGLMVTQLAAVGIATAGTVDIRWRRTFMVAALVCVATTAALVITLSTLTIFQRIEVFSIALGTLMVVMGYIGWSRESSDVKSDVVSFNLIAGSWIVAAPFIIGIIGDRIADSVDMWRYIHEIGGLSVGLALLGSGLLCQIRSTTISGTTILGVFVLGNLLLINIPDQLQQTSVLMMIGGGLFFAASVLLSIYRDALMSLPEKIRTGKGVFQVLKWR